MLNCDINDEWFLKSIMWTDESKFSREGIKTVTKHAEDVCLFFIFIKTVCDRSTINVGRNRAHS